jgi:hypothetical protein
MELWGRQGDERCDRRAVGTACPEPRGSRVFPSLARSAFLPMRHDVAIPYPACQAANGTRLHAQYLKVHVRQ